MIFSKETEEVLKRSGWFEGRNIDTSKMIELLESRGFEISESVEKFLREFGMLTIEVNVNYINESLMKEYNLRNKDIHNTDVFNTLGDTLIHDRISRIEYFAYEKLVVVGEIYNGNSWLMLSESGKVYSDNGKVGDDFIKAFETLINPIENRIIGWQFL